MGKPGVLTQSQARMPLDYFKRKWMALASISPQDKAARYKQQTLVANFKAHFSHYSRSQDLVDSFMAWLRSVRIHDSELWALYASYLHTHSSIYSSTALVSKVALFKAVPGDLAALLEKRVTEDLGAAGTKDLAALLKITKSEAIIRKIKEEGRIIVNNECDFGFFAGLFLPRMHLFPDVADTLKQQLERILPTIRNVQTLCTFAKSYAENKVQMDADLLQKIETAILTSSQALKELDVNEVFLAFHTPAYYHRISKSFWTRFEERVLSSAHTFRPSWLLATFARHNFPSSELLATVLPLWKEETTRLRLKEQFREGLSALPRYSGLTEQDKAWVCAQLAGFRTQFTPFDVSTVLRGVAGAGWYDPVLWKLLLERFVVGKGKAKDVDKSMVYVAIRCLELDGVQLREVEDIVRQYREELRTTFEKLRFPVKPTALHSRLASTLLRLQLPYTEFSTIAELYRPNFTLPASNLVIICQDWPFHLCLNSSEMATGTQMMLRHLNKAGYKVLIVANEAAAETTFESVLAQARQATDIANFQIV